MADRNVHKNHRQRMRREFYQTGFKSWHEHIVLEYILYPSIPRRDTNEIAHRLINRCGSFVNVFTSSKELLMSVDGVGEGTADYLCMLGELIKYHTDKKYNNKRLELNSGECEKYLMNLFSDKKQENFYLICLDGGNRILHQEMLFEGGLEATEIDSGRILRIAVRSGAASVVFAHNHPSGVAKPSYTDIETTLKLEAKLRVVGIGLLDHIIVTDLGCASMRDMKYLKDPTKKTKNTQPEEGI